MNNKEREEALTLGILEAIDESSDVTQRYLARRTGVALGLANSYLKRCVRKGLVKTQQAPANRYLYYLTPKGFAEKSRLTARYLSVSFQLYRRASASYEELFRAFVAEGGKRVVLYGACELAEIASLRAQEAGAEVVAIVDPGGHREFLLGRAVLTEIPRRTQWDACALTTLTEPQDAYESLAETVPYERILVPEILGLKTRAA